MNTCDSCWTAKWTRVISDGRSSLNVCEACAIKAGFEPTEALLDMLARLEATV